MARRPLRTLLTSNVAVGATAIALLGGGAALAAEGGGSDVELQEPVESEEPVEPVEPVDQNLTSQSEDESDSESENDPPEVASDPAQALEEVEASEDEPDNGVDWALGNSDNVNELTQAQRIEEFCRARRGQAGGDTAATDGTADDEERSEPVGVPPFCDIEDAQAPNAHGKATSEQARNNREHPAHSNRPDHAGPPSDSDEIESEDADGDSSDDAESTTVEPSGAPDEERGGPPDHANARANRGG